MGFSEDRLSTVPALDEWIPPDERERPNFTTDYEAGPIAVNDTSEGLFYQSWTLTWDSGTGNFILTPETTGSSVIAYNHANVTQCTLAFDQNGRPTFAFTADGLPKLYWYDTLEADFVTDTLEAGVTYPTVCLDDKRSTQTNASDIILWYTKPNGGTYDLYFRKQRNRYETEYPLREGVLPFMYKAGMHYGLRVQLLLLGTQVAVLPPEVPVGPVIPQANIDFELGDVYWNKTNDFTIDSSDPFAGSFSAILNTIPAEYSSLENSVYTIITPDEPISVSCEVKGSVATTIKLGIKFYNSAYALLATDTSIENVITSWAQITYNTVAPASAVYASIFVESSSTDGVVSFDNFELNY